MLGQLPGTMASLLVISTSLQLSVALAEPVASGSVEAVQSRVALGGQVMVGAVLSLTVIVCTQLAALPQPSVAVQVRAMM